MDPKGKSDVMFSYNYTNRIMSRLYSLSHRSSVGEWTAGENRPDLHSSRTSRDPGEQGTAKPPAERQIVSLDSPRRTVTLKRESWQGEPYLIKALGGWRRRGRQPRPALWRRGSMKTFHQKPRHRLHSCCIGQRFISELGKQALGDTAAIPSHSTPLISGGGAPVGAEWCKGDGETVRFEGKEISSSARTIMNS